MINSRFRLDEEESLAGKSISLRPVLPADVEFLYEQEVSSQLAFRWRLGGEHPNPYHYGESLWSGVLASFIAVSSEADDRVGVFTAYNADFRNRHAYLAGALFPAGPNGAFRRAFVAVEAMSLLIEYCFRGWDFRKLYLEVGEYNLPQFESMIGRVAVEEARLASHIFFDWNWWDLVTLAIWRDTWEPSVYRSRLCGDGTATTSTD